MPRIKGYSSASSLLIEATAKLSRADFDELVEFAENTGRRRGAVVREAIQQYLRHNSKTRSAA